MSILAMEMAQRRALLAPSAALWVLGAAQDSLYGTGDRLAAAPKEERKGTKGERGVSGRGSPFSTAIDSGDRLCHLMCCCRRPDPQVSALRAGCLMLAYQRVGLRAEGDLGAADLNGEGPGGEVLDRHLLHVVDAVHEAVALQHDMGQWGWRVEIGRTGQQPSPQVGGWGALAWGGPHEEEGPAEPRDPDGEVEVVDEGLLGCRGAGVVVPGESDAQRASCGLEAEDLDLPVESAAWSTTWSFQPAPEPCWLRQYHGSGNERHVRSREGLQEEERWPKQRLCSKPRGAGTSSGRRLRSLGGRTASVQGGGLLLRAPLRRLRQARLPR